MPILEIIGQMVKGEGQNTRPYKLFVLIAILMYVFWASVFFTNF